MAKKKRKTKAYYKKRAIGKFFVYLISILFIPSAEKAYAAAMRQNGDFIWASIMDFLAVLVVIGLIIDWSVDVYKAS